MGGTRTSCSAQNWQHGCAAAHLSCLCEVEAERVCEVCWQPCQHRVVEPAGCNGEGSNCLPKDTSLSMDASAACAAAA